MPDPYDTDLDAQRGGPTQAPLRGTVFPQDNTDPTESYPLESSGGNPSSEIELTGEGWRAMIRRNFGARMKGY